MSLPNVSLIEPDDKAQQPQPRITPHLRLNSGTNNPIVDDGPFSDRHKTTSSSRPIPAQRDLNRNGPVPLSLRPPARPPGLKLQRPGSSSREALLEPPQSRPPSRIYRDSPLHSPIESPISPDFPSRRTSFDTEPKFSPYASPTDSRVPSRDGSEEGVNTQTITEKFNVMPSAGLLIYPEDVEKDDWLHTPDPNGKDKNDKADCFSKRALVNVGGLTFITLGVLLIFIGYPLSTWVNKIRYPKGVQCHTDPNCISSTEPLLKNVRQGLIDPDTPKSAMSRKDIYGNTQNLVFSDEFNKDGRSFYSNDDPYFQAVDLWYGVTQDLEWYDPDAITTNDGVLEIRFDAYQNHGLNYRSGMLQSWNQMCFKGGYMEASISLPGAGDTIGFWPGFWSMGNLGRPGYASTTDGLWPYTYWDKCDLGITKNQSQSDGLSFLPGMRLPACTCPGAEHPSPGNSRSAPEIDALEGSVTYLDPPAQAAIGQVSQSIQMAPFDIWYQPNYDFLELYDPSITMMNAYRGGYYQQALSGVTNLNNDWYNGKAYQTYAFEYSPGDTGYTTWFVGPDKSWHLDARALGPNGNVGQRVIPTEPMAIVTNLGMSASFAALNLTGIAPLLPVTMRLDYIRIYQGDDDLITCDPPGYPTTDYIKQHPKAYQNHDKTLWEETGYGWPKNSFVDTC